MLIWLLASQTDNKIPADSNWIAKKIGVHEEIDLNTLEHYGFIKRYQDASKLHQNKSTDATVETETEGETEAEYHAKEECLYDDGTTPFDYLIDDETGEVLN